MDLQVLVSTMNQKEHSLIEKMNIQSNSIIVNQCNEHSTLNIEKSNFQVKWINSTERGLSRSRNLALDNATGEVCIFADDDLEYLSNYQDIILDQFKLNPDADIIAFQVEGVERKFKKYYSKPRKINYLTSMKISSVEIAFRLDSINKAGVRFDERFGAGSEFFMGEENIFLFNCLKQGLKIMYVPIKIADLHIGESTWFKGYNKEYFISRGAMFTAMSRRMSLFFISQFAIRKYKLYRNEISFYGAIKYMLQGWVKLVKRENTLV